MREKIKVLHIVHQMAYGGIETFLMSMLRHYDRDIFHMDILCTGKDEGVYAAEARALGAQLIHCPIGLDQMRFICRLKTLLRNGGYKAVNNHLSDIGSGAILAAYWAGVPARVSSYHSNYLQRSWPKNLYMRVMRQLAAKYATDITTSSPDVTESHFGRMKLPPGRIHSISYGVDVDFFEKTKEVQPLPGYGASSGKLVVGHIGHFTPQKNHEALLKIICRVVREMPQVIFLLRNSGGPLRQQVEQQVVQMGLSKHIEWVQGLSDIRQFYASIDVFVLPSRHEGMPLTIIEAQAAGKPLVASDLEGIRIATADEMKCNLFAVDDIESFSRCLIHLLRDKEKREYLGKIGHAFVKKNLDVKYAVQKYQCLYLPKDSLCQL